MESDLSRIPVEPVPFANRLVSLSKAFAAGRATIVAIGSSTTAGERNIPPYPGRLLGLLQKDYPRVLIAMKNKGIGGQEAPEELARFDADVIPENPDLVIWQVGTNAVWQNPDAHPPSFQETTQAIREGLAKLHKQTAADIVLMDLQYVPAVLTPAKRDKAVAMVEAIDEGARDGGASVFRRFAFMKGLYDVEKVSFDRMVDPADIDRLHQSDWVTERLAWALEQAIVGAVETTRVS